MISIALVSSVLAVMGVVTSPSQMVLRLFVSVIAVVAVVVVIVVVVTVVVGVAIVICNIELIIYPRNYMFSFRFVEPF